MPDTCTHQDAISTAEASGDGCVECLEQGTAWVHLRRCTACGHVGCCDSSPRAHATGHNAETGHPVMQSFEPGEEWYWCYADGMMFERDGESRSLSHR